MPAPRDRLPDELMKALMPAEQYAAWQRQQEASKEFWRTLNGPAQRPLGSNADEWHLFVEENKDSSTYLAVQIAEAIDDAERRGARDALKERAETRAATTTTERARRAIKALREPDASLHGVANTTTWTQGCKEMNAYVGGWPGYHTHWTPIEVPVERMTEPELLDALETLAPGR